LISIIVADTHAIVRRGLREILDERTGMIVRGEAQTCAEVRNLLDGPANFDIVLLDVRTPDGDGMDFLAELQRSHPNLPVVLLSANFTEKLALDAIKAGAVSFITREIPPEQLVQVIRAAATGRRYFTPEMAEAMANALSSVSRSSSEPPPHAALSERELQVLCMLGEGQAIKEIAFTLGLSDKTVSTYRMRILEKLRLQSTADLIRYTIRHELSLI